MVSKDFTPLHAFIPTRLQFISSRAGLVWSRRRVDATASWRGRRQRWLHQGSTRRVTCGHGQTCALLARLALRHHDPGVLAQALRTTAPPESEGGRGHNSGVLPQDDGSQAHSCVAEYQVEARKSMRSEQRPFVDETRHVRKHAPGCVPEQASSGGAKTGHQVPCALKDRSSQQPKRPVYSRKPCPRSLHGRTHRAP
jgi:hypothetical protein